MNRTGFTEFSPEFLDHTYEYTVLIQVEKWSVAVTLVVRTRTPFLVFDMNKVSTLIFST
jgi:hypothetical protein